MLDIDDAERGTHRPANEAGILSFREAASRVIGLSPADHRLLQYWFDELERPCSPDREASLVFQLCNTLGGFMGIEPEILFPAFLSNIRRERRAR
jgi:hypothetical protein